MKPILLFLAIFILVATGAIRSALPSTGVDQGQLLIAVKAYVSACQINRSNYHPHNELYVSDLVYRPEMQTTAEKEIEDAKAKMEAAEKHRVCETATDALLEKLKETK